MREKQSHAFLDEGEARTVSLIECHGKLEPDDRRLIKCAAAEEAMLAAAKIEPRKDRVYLLNIGLGSTEFWGPNNNGDSWPEAGLLGKWPSDVPASFFDRFKARIPKIWGYLTFRNAHTFEEHRNHDPRLAIGGVHDTFWNPRMHRVENLIWIDRNHPRGRNWADKVDRGEDLGTSMAAKVPFDRCSMPGCGNLAPTRKQYCEHLRRGSPGYRLRQILPDGTPVTMINDFPAFFDQSMVRMPAAPEALVLMKVASESTQDAVASVPMSMNRIARLYASESPLPSLVLEKLSYLGPSNVLSAADRLGVVLRPSEVFALVFGPEVRDKIATADAFVFDPNCQTSGSDLQKLASASRSSLLGHDPVKVERAIDLLLPFLAKRSYHEPQLLVRMLQPHPPLVHPGSPSAEIRELLGVYHDLYRRACNHGGYGG